MHKTALAVALLAGSAITTTRPVFVRDGYEVPPELALSDDALMQPDPTLPPDALPGIVAPRPPNNTNEAKRLRRAARYGDVPVVINRKPSKPARKPRKKKAA